MIVPFEVDGTGHMRNKVIDSNVLTTAFGKGKVELFYWDKKKAMSLLQAKGLQLPSFLPQDGFIHSIREKEANVNMKFEDVTQTQHLLLMKKEM